MAEVQRYFIDFHNKIKLSDENETLREKREAVLDKLAEQLPKVFEEREDDPPAYTPFNRGSYAMGTGTIPIDCDYDIDIGLAFDITTKAYPDPLEVKQWVYKALRDHTDNVRIKEPCITVQYHIGDEPVYHVDIAVYAHTSASTDDMHLARGKPSSAPEQKIWEPADPKGLLQEINQRSDDTGERSQFRRTIRYLKRWKDLKFPSAGNAAPIGIGITVGAYYWFAPQRPVVDVFANKRKDNDLEALRLFVDKMISNFQLALHDNEIAERLSVQLPVRPHNDVFKKMTNRQMENFKQKLQALSTALEEATEETDPAEACKVLERQFGEDFPIPEVEETAQRKSPAIVSSSASA